MNHTVAAKELGVSRPTWRKYRDEGCPTEDLTAARAWIEARRESDGRGGKRASGSSFLELKEELSRATLRKVEAEAELKEYEAEIARKNLVSMDEAKAYLSEVLAPLRVLLDSLPKSCAPRCNPADPEIAEAAIREAVDGIFRAMDKEREDGSNVS